MTPIELFNSWLFGGLMTWYHEGIREEIKSPLVLLYMTEKGFLAVPPGYQFALPEPHEREFPGPLEIKDGALVFPQGKIEDLEVSAIGFNDVSQWQEDIAAKGRTYQQEREAYREIASYRITS